MSENLCCITFDFTAETSLGDELACGSPGSTAPSASQQPMLPPPPCQISNATTVANFSYLDDGTFYLAKGVVVRSEAAFKIMRNLKPTLVVKDTAEAVWGKDVLEKKSVTGMVAPRKKSLGEVAKEPLTPEKVAVVAATLKHWGAEKNVDVDATLLNLGRLLSEKIQDVLKSKRRVKFQ
nr:BEN domain-containing protein 5-like [Dermacentor andersoni]